MIFLLYLVSVFLSRRMNETIPKRDSSTFRARDSDTSLFSSKNISFSELLQSEEDRQLQEELTMLVERLSVGSQELSFDIIILSED